MDSKDRLCNSLATNAVYYSKDIVRCRKYMLDGPRSRREFWDGHAARSEQRMIDKANRLIELRS